jgi:hypothetical protein
MKYLDIAMTMLAIGDPGTQRLVKAVQAVLTIDILDMTALKKALGSLMENLSSTAGRTDANYRVVGSYFMFDKLWSTGNFRINFMIFLRIWQVLCTIQLLLPRLQITFTQRLSSYLQG